MAIASLTTLWQREGRGQPYVRVTRWEPDGMALKLTITEPSVCFSSEAPETAPAPVSRLERLCEKAGVLTTWPTLSARFCAGVRPALQPAGMNDAPKADGSSILRVAVAG